MFELLEVKNLSVSFHGAVDSPLPQLLGGSLRHIQPDLIPRTHTEDKAHLLTIPFIEAAAAHDTSGVLQDAPGALATSSALRSVPGPTGWQAGTRGRPLHIPGGKRLSIVPSDIFLQIKSVGAAGFVESPPFSQAGDNLVVPVVSGKAQVPL